jgi:hypothetical protein
MTDVHRVRPHILRRTTGETTEDVATAHVDGREVLIVPVTEEAAVEAAATPAYAGLEPTPVCVEDIEEVCSNHGLALVGFSGFDTDRLSIVSVEVVSLVLEETTE